jgi:rubrerythrin
VKLTIHRIPDWMQSVGQKLDNVKELDTLSDRELARAIRDAIIAEQDAVKQYEVIADSTSNEKAKKVLQDISDEEKIHVGELLELLKGIDSSDDNFLEEGRKEVNSSVEK